jgi:hypothetical protein
LGGFPGNAHAARQFWKRVISQVLKRRSRAVPH